MVAVPRQARDDIRRLIPEALRGDGGAFDECGEFFVRDLGVHLAGAGERAEAAVGARDDALAADNVGVADEPLSNDLRMLDIVAG